MPYNPAGLFSLVASYFATPGGTIRTEQHNPPLEDIAAALSRVMLRDGRAPMEGPLDMNGWAITDIASGDSPGSVATVAQVTPIGGLMMWAGAAAPAGWLLCYGQAVSRTTYSALFAVVGTAFGAGDGSTTFNLPDIRGRVVAGLDTMGGASADRLNPTITSGVIGSVGGTQTTALGQAHLPSVSFSVTIPAGQGSHAHTYSRANLFPTTAGNAGGVQSAQFLNPYVAGTSDAATLPAMSGTAASGGSGTAHLNVQPTMVLNMIIKVSHNG